MILKMIFNWTFSIQNTYSMCILFPVDMNVQFKMQWHEDGIYHRKKLNATGFLMQLFLKVVCAKLYVI